MSTVSARVGKKWDAAAYKQANHWDTSSADATVDRPMYSASTGAYQYLQAELEVSRKRNENYRMFDEMDDEHSESALALDIYADNCTQIGVTADASLQDKGHVVSFLTDRDDVRGLLEQMRDSLRLDERAWSLARGLAKYGDVFEEVVVDQDLRIDRMKELPVKQMVRNEDPYGILQPKAFIELSEGRDKILAEFQDWEVVHYRLQRNNAARYGTSILHAVRRVYRQLRMIEDAMVIARLTRANMRMAHYVDTGNLTPPQARAFLKEVKQEMRKRRLVGPDGRLRLDQNPLTTEEDLFIATHQGSNAKVEQLYGDLNIGNLTDVEYFQNKFFGGVKVPKSYAGVERDVNAKNTLTMQDIQFARSCRRIQLAMRSGYRQLAELFLLLNGQQLDGRKRRQGQSFQVALPGLQTQDGLREWEMKRIQLEVARIGAQELYMDPITLYTKLLGFTEKEAKKLYQGKESDWFEDKKNTNALKSFSAAQDNKVKREMVEAIGPEGLGALRDLCEMALEQHAAQAARAAGNAV